MKKQAYILGTSLLVMSGLTFATTISASAQIFDVSARQFFKDKDGKINSQYRFDFTTVDAKSAKDIQAPPLPGYHLKTGSKMLVAGSDAVIFDYEKNEEVITPTPTPTTNSDIPTEKSKQIDDSKTIPVEKEHQDKADNEVKVETTTDDKLEIKIDKTEEKQDNSIKSDESNQSKDDNLQAKKSDNVKTEIVDKTESKDDKVQEQQENLKSVHDSLVKETKNENKDKAIDKSKINLVGDNKMESKINKSENPSEKTPAAMTEIPSKPIKQVRASDKNSKSTLTKQSDALIYTNNEIPTLKTSSLNAKKATKGVPYQSINDSKSLKNYVKDAPAVTEIKAANNHDFLKEHGEMTPSVTLQSVKGKTVKIKNKKLKDVNGTQSKTAKAKLPALGEDNHASKMMLLVLGILSLIVILFNKVRTKNKD